MNKAARSRKLKKKTENSILFREGFCGSTKSVENELSEFKF